MEKPAGHRGIDFRNAIMNPSVLMDSAGFIQFFAEFGELPDEEIEAAVIVIIEPNRARSPPRRSYSRLFGNIRERTVAIVVIEDAAAVLRHIDIRKTVAVVITHGNALPVTAGRHPGSFRYIGERAVAIVFIEGVAQRQVRCEEIALPAIYQIDVHPAIVVVVEKCAART